MSSLRHLDDDALAAAIGSVGRELRWPATPDVAPSVARRIVTIRPRPGLSVTWPALPGRRRLALLLAAVLLLVGGTALAAKLVIEIGTVTIETVPGLPTSLPTETEFGAPVTLEEAERLTGIAPKYPDALGPPDDVWVDEGLVGPDPTRWIAMAWDPVTNLPPLGDTSRGAVLIQFHGQADAAFKTVYAEAGAIRFVDLGDGQAAWVTGPHELRLAVDGALRSFRVDGNVLLWQDGTDTFRFESTLSLVRARAIAEGMAG